MKKLITLTLVALALTACNPTPATPSASPTAAQPSAVPPTALSPTDMPPTAIPIVRQDLYQVIAQPNEQDATQTDVFILNTDTAEQTLFLTLGDVYSNHYHFAEYHNGSLYIIRRIGYDGYPDDEWTDELWRYDTQKNPLVLYSAKGLDFRTAPDESFTAINVPPAYAADQTTLLAPEHLLFVSAQGEIAHDMIEEQLGTAQADYRFNNALWSDASNTFWGKQVYGPNAIMAFIKIEPGSWAITTYDVSAVNLQFDYAFNPNTLKLAHSDRPFDFMAPAPERDVTLFIYDLASQETTTVAQALGTTDTFKPKWLDDHTLEYNDLNSDGRQTYIVP